ncbi:hypothetical protein INR49_012969 [Caranx melampygus]|nr:hypothetical protein INR49_012969 [Caranx melampygus]
MQYPLFSFLLTPIEGWQEEGEEEEEEYEVPGNHADRREGPYTDRGLKMCLAYIHPLKAAGKGLRQGEWMGQEGRKREAEA